MTNAHQVIDMTARMAETLMKKEMMLAMVIPASPPVFGRISVGAVTAGTAQTALMVRAMLMMERKSFID
jgi:hypothetical protein